MNYYFGTEREIMVGDKVRVVRSTDGNSSIVGKVGTVRDFDSISHRPGIEFEERINRGHNLRGTCSVGFGWYCDAHTLEYLGSLAVPVKLKKYCCECNGEINRKSKLGARLFKFNWRCDSCIAKEIAKVHPYHFAKGLKYNITRDKITFGAEIEIDSPSRDWDEDGIDRDGFVKECVEYACANNYPLIMSYENDGSLNEDGVECVTAPLTVNEWKSDEVKKQIQYLFDTADEYGFNFDADNNAGLHIHVGRKDLCGDDREVSDAVGLLMGWACTRLWDAGLSDLAGRESNSYCKPLDKNEHGHMYTGKGLKDTDAVYDRYSFVNIQNSATLELRIFNRATCYEDVLVAIDMCYMLGKWATKKINAFLKRNSYSAKNKEFTDALEYADRVTWASLVKFSKFPEITLPRMRSVGINV